MRSLSVIAFSLVLTSFVQAEEPAPPPPAAEAEAEAAPSESAAVSSDSTSRHELAPELLAKLTPAQVAEILKLRETRRSQHSVEDVLVPVLVPLFFFLCVAFVVALPLYLSFRRHGHLQETLRLMVEKGVQIPTELLTPPSAPVRKHSDLRRGIILVAAGVSLAVCLALVGVGPLERAWALGLIPMIIGAGYILVWKLEGKKNQEA